MNTILDNSVTVGCLVRFYDSQKAHADKDHSGTNSKYYPIGKVISIYDYKSIYGYIDRVCDIQIGDRISKSHFISGIEIIKEVKK